MDVLEVLSFFPTYTLSSFGIYQPLFLFYNDILQMSLIRWCQEQNSNSPNTRSFTTRDLPLASAKNWRRYFLRQDALRDEIAGALNTRCDSSPTFSHSHRAALLTVMLCVVLFVAYNTPLLSIYWGWCQGKKLAPRVVLLYVGKGKQV